MAKIRNRKSRKKVSCFFTSILLIFGFTVWENTAAKLAESTPRKPGENGESQHSGIRQLLRARFYHSTKFRLPAHFVLWESCWGCHPKPAFLRLAPLEKIPQKLFRIFFKNTSAFAPVFLPLVRGHHEQKGGHRP